MIDNTALKLTLLVAYRHMRAQFELLTSVLAEVEALRSTMAENDPTLKDVMKRNHHESIRKMERTVAAELAKFDEMMYEIESGQVVS